MAADGSRTDWGHVQLAEPDNRPASFFAALVRWGISLLASAASARRGLAPSATGAAYDKAYGA